MRIVFALYPGVTHLDFTGPHQVFSRLPGAQVLCASATGEDIEADGLVFTGLKRLSDIEACDVICVPGGFGTTDAMQDPAFMAEVKRLAAGARYVTSVCTGSLVLGAAGLLKATRATSHWLFLEQLREFGADPVGGRYVEDGKVVTAAGVSAGIDMALHLVGRETTPEVAQAIQLGIEYDPQPPFDSGSPEKAAAPIVELVTAVSGESAEWLDGSSG
jgi:cyclohexyl-isocyanide hydratase